MNKCLNCGSGLTGRQTQFCSKKCNMAYRRNGNKPTVTDQPATVTKTPVTGNKLECVTDELPQQGGLVTDMDWWGKDTLDSLPHGVVRPCNIPDDTDCDTPGPELHRKINAYSGLDWIASPEYAELIFRLTCFTVEELEEQGVFVPQWKASA